MRKPASTVAIPSDSSSIASALVVRATRTSRPFLTTPKTSVSAERRHGHGRMGSQEDAGPVLDEQLLQRFNQRCDHRRMQHDIDFVEKEKSRGAADRAAG